MSKPNKEAISYLKPIHFEWANNANPTRLESGSQDINFGRTDSGTPELKWLICITLYNEEAELLKGTIEALWENVRVLNHKRACSWKNIAIFIVVDNPASKIPHLVNFCADKLHLIPKKFQDDVNDGFPVSQNKGAAHIFMNTLNKWGKTSLQIMLCIKARNFGKVHSHAVAFNGVGARLNPTYFTMIDCGTLPRPESMYIFQKEFDENKQVAGVCGELKVERQESKMVPIMERLVHAVQYYEYKAANLVDRAFESKLGYISVLPGAFSAYRWVSVSAPEVLDKYLKSMDGPLANGGGDIDFMSANRYLTEDRELSLWLVLESWLCRYCKEATARTDPPKSLSQFIKQRRRWINGAFFSTLHNARLLCTHVWHTDHIPERKVSMFLYGGFLLFTLLLQVMYPSFFCFTVYLFVGNFVSNTFFTFMAVAFVLIGVILQVVWFSSDAIKQPQEFEKKLASIFKFNLCVGFGLVVLSIYYVRQQLYEDNGAATWGIPPIIYILCATSSAIAPFIAAVCHWKFTWRLLVSFGAFFLFIPNLMLTFNIYSMANVNDISWGNRDNLSKDVQEQLQSKGAHFRNLVLLFYALLNITALCLLAWGAPGTLNLHKTFLPAMILYAGITIFIKLIVSIIFIAVDKNRNKGLKDKKKDPIIPAVEDYFSAAGQLSPEQRQQMEVIDDHYIRSAKTASKFWETIISMPTYDSYDRAILDQRKKKHKYRHLKLHNPRNHQRIITRVNKITLAYIAAVKACLQSFRSAKTLHGTPDLEERFRMFQSDILLIGERPLQIAEEDEGIEFEEGDEIQEDVSPLLEPEFLTKPESEHFAAVRCSMFVVVLVVIILTIFVTWFTHYQANRVVDIHLRDMFIMGNLRIEQAKNLGWIEELDLPLNGEEVVSVANPASSIEEYIEKLDNYAEVLEDNFDSRGETTLVNLFKNIHISTYSTRTLIQRFMVAARALADIDDLDDWKLLGNDDNTRFLRQYGMGTPEDLTRDTLPNDLSNIFYLQETAALDALNYMNSLIWGCDIAVVVACIIVAFYAAYQISVRLSLVGRKVPSVATLALLVSVEEAIKYKQKLKINFLEPDMAALVNIELQEVQTTNDLEKHKEFVEAQQKLQETMEDAVEEAKVEDDYADDDQSQITESVLGSKRDSMFGTVDEDDDDFDEDVDVIDDNMSINSNVLGLSGVSGNKNKKHIQTIEEESDGSYDDSHSGSSGSDYDSYDSSEYDRSELSHSSHSGSESEPSVDFRNETRSLHSDTPYGGADDLYSTNSRRNHQQSLRRFEDDLQTSPEKRRKSLADKNVPDALRGVQSLFDGNSDSESSQGDNSSGDDGHVVKLNKVDVLLENQSDKSRSEDSDDSSDGGLFGDDNLLNRAKSAHNLIAEANAKARVSSVSHSESESEYSSASRQTGSSRGSVSSNDSHYSDDSRDSRDSRYSDDSRDRRDKKHRHRRNSGKDSHSSHSHSEYDDSYDEYDGSYDESHSGSDRSMSENSYSSHGARYSSDSEDSFRNEVSQASKHYDNILADDNHDILPDDSISQMERRSHLPQQNQFNNMNMGMGGSMVGTEYMSGMSRASNLMGPSLRNDDLDGMSLFSKASHLPKALQSFSTISKASKLDTFTHFNPALSGGNSSVFGPPSMIGNGTGSMMGPPSMMGSPSMMGPPSMMGDASMMGSMMGDPSMMGDDGTVMYDGGTVMMGDPDEMAIAMPSNNNVIQMMKFEDLKEKDYKYGKQVNWFYDDKRKTNIFARISRIRFGRTSLLVLIGLVVCIAFSTLYSMFCVDTINSIEPIIRETRYSFDVLTDMTMMSSHIFELVEGKDFLEARDTAKLRMGKIALNVQDTWLNVYSGNDELGLEGCRRRNDARDDLLRHGVCLLSGSEYSDSCDEGAEELYINHDLIRSNELNSGINLWSNNVQELINSDFTAVQNFVKDDQDRATFLLKAGELDLGFGLKNFTQTFYDEAEEIADDSAIIASWFILLGIPVLCLVVMQTWRKIMHPMQYQLKQVNEFLDCLPPPLRKELIERYRLHHQIAIKKNEYEK